MNETRNTLSQIVEKSKLAIAFLKAHWEATLITAAIIAAVIIVDAVARQLYRHLTKPDATTAQQTRPVDYAGDRGYEACQFSANIKDPEERHAYCINFSDNAFR